MNLAEFWNGAWGSPALSAVVNHLWQSTLVAGAAWGLALALRKNHARTRYWVWFAASVKFLVPFSALMELGAWMRTLFPVSVARPQVAGVIEQVAQPFAPVAMFATGTATVAVHRASVWPVGLLVIWGCGAVVVAIKWALGWMRLRRAVRMARPLIGDASGAKAPNFRNGFDVRAKARTLHAGAITIHAEARTFHDRKRSGMAEAAPSGNDAFPQGLKPLMCSAVDVRAEARTLHAEARTLQRLHVDVPVLCSAELIEPGIFGVFRPVLLLPDGILERLSAAQLRAVVAHEMCHVRRRDNLTFAVHMIVETLFWFFPLVWWIGTRLIDERERSCDEAVLSQGGEAQVYAEGILNVCKFCVESPVACAAGVTGSDLKKRIVRIMSEHVVRGLDRRRKLLLGAAGVLAIALPLGLGLVHTGAILAETRPEDELANLPKFDVASVKPHKDEPGGMMRIGFGMTPDGIRADGVPLQMIVTQAFGISRDRILNEPDWVASTRYDMEAKVSPEDAPKLKGLTPKQRGVMLLPVLEDRFGLKFHHETRELGVYTLVVAKGGPKLKAAQPDDAADGQAGAGGDRGPVTRPGGGDAGPDGPKPDAPMPSPRPGQAFMRMSPQGMMLQARGVPIDTLVSTLSRELGATVIDKTSLTDKYDYTLNFMPEAGARAGFGPPPPPPPPPASGGGTAQSGGPESAPADAPPSLVDAVQKQLGLKLVREKEPVDVIVIDHIEQPSAN